MADYDKEKTRAQVKQILDAEYERRYPFELEKELSPIMKLADQNDDNQLTKEIFWEVDLLNRAFGHKTTHEGKEISEISNKWQHFLEGGEFKPLENPPFCTWDANAVPYYKERFDDTKSYLGKARYAFAIMVFSSGQERFQWMKKSVENWKKCAEKYVQDGKYNKEFYEVPPFAYEFALKLSLSFKQQELAKEIFDSLHKNILLMISVGEKRWHIEFLEVESKYIHQFNETEDLKKESVKKIKEIIEKLETEFKESTDKQKSLHFIRHYIEILLSYKTEDDYELRKKIAESFITEAAVRDDPLVKSAFYNDAIKRYQTMQGAYPAKKAFVDKRLDELILEMKDINTKAAYKQVQTKIEITKEQVDEYIRQLKTREGNLLISFIKDNSLIPGINETRKMTISHKKQFPLQFIIPVTVYNAEEPVAKVTTEPELFEYHVGRNTLFGVKLGEIMCKITLESLKKELGTEINDIINELIEQEELLNIKKALNKGFTYTFGERKDFIAGMHVLVPYIEEIIRLIIKKAGKVEVVLEQNKTKYFRGIELGGLLTDESVAVLIGADFQKALQVLLIDNTQANIRNELLHGRLASEKINEPETIFIAYCILKLLTVLKETEKKA